MSGLIFVQDAHGTPLMPTAAAHARKLLQRAKARRLPHHTFTIIQLAQAVVAPALRPLFLGVRIHTHTAVLALVAEGTRTVLPLLRIVVDLAYGPTSHIWLRRVGHRRMRRGSRNHRGRYTGLTQAGRTPRPTNVSVHHYAQIIVRVLGSLRALAPISHLVMLPSAVLSPLAASALFQQLYTHPACAGLIVVDSVAVEQITTVQIAALLQTLVAGADPFVSIPVAVAVCFRDRFDRRSRSEEQSRFRLLGSLAWALYGDHGLVGIVAAVRPAGRVVLHVPRLANANDVVWQRVHVQPYHLRVLSTDQVIFLPMPPHMRS